MIVVLRFRFGRENGKKKSSRFRRRKRINARIHIQIRACYALYINGDIGTCHLFLSPRVCVAPFPRSLGCGSSVIIFIARFFFSVSPSSSEGQRQRRPNHWSERPAVLHNNNIIRYYTAGKQCTRAPSSIVVYNVQSIDTHLQIFSAFFNAVPLIISDSYKIYHERAGRRVFYGMKKISNVSIRHKESR